MRLVVVLVTLVAALAIPAGPLLARGGEEADFRGSQPAAALTLPVFSLEDDEGQEVRSAELRGKAVAVTFLDVQCTEACPIIAAQVGQAMRALGGDRSRVEALAISADPVRDTAAGIDAFLRRHRAKGDFATSHGTVAPSPARLDGVPVLSAHDTGESNMHSAPVRVYDGEGRWRSTLNSGVDLTPANLANDLRLAFR